MVRGGRKLTFGRRGCLLILFHAPWAVAGCREIVGVRRDVPDGPACDDPACEFLAPELVESEPEELPLAMSHSGISRCGGGGGAVSGAADG